MLQLKCRYVSTLTYHGVMSRLAEMLDSTRYNERRLCLFDVNDLSEC